MRIVIAPDSFKECASARTVAEAMATGLRRVLPDGALTLVPMADGGEGTVDAVLAATEGVAVEVEVTGPVGRPVSASYALIDEGKTAVIEMAAASGLALVPRDERDPRVTTTFGTGELIRHAARGGARRVVVGLGGSATNDGGSGMAQAVGYVLLDKEGKALARGGGALSGIAVIDGAGKEPLLRDMEIVAATDVDNPLCGPEGASYVYGGQKGATAEIRKELDEGLAWYAKCLENQLAAKVLDVPGAGAAGGLAAGLVAFLGATIRPGVEVVGQLVGLEEHIRDADLVFTGEGKLDGQTLHGKTPMGVAKIAKGYGVPVIALAGTLGEGYESLYDEGIRWAVSIQPRPMPLEESIRDAPRYIADAAEGALRVFMERSQ